jgi:hypothetical protein
MLISTQKHTGLVHFATDIWSLTNYHAFVGWIIHLYYKGHILSFVIDIIEVPEVHFILLVFCYLNCDISISHIPKRLLPEHFTVC